MVKIRDVAVIGSGPIGTANAQALSEREEIERITIYTGNEIIEEQINRFNENKVHFPGFKLGKKIRASRLRHKKVAEADLTLLAIPTSGIRENLEEILPWYQNQLIMTLNKGMEAKGQPKFSHEIVKEVSGKFLHLHLYNPFASAIISGETTQNFIASMDLGLAEEVKSQIETESYRVEVTDDMLALEIAGVIKNVVAIVAGMAENLGKSRSTQSIILSEGFREGRELGEKLRANDRILSDLLLRDLWLSGLNEDSRHYKFGKEFAKEYSKSRFNPKAKMGNLLARWRKRKHKTFIREAREVYEEIVVDGLVDGMHDLLSAPVRIIDILSRSSRIDIEATEGTVSLPPLLQKSRNLGLELVIVEESYKVIWEKSESPELAMKHILDKVLP